MVSCLAAGETALANRVRRWTDRWISRIWHSTVSFSDIVRAGACSAERSDMTSTSGGLARPAAM